MPAHLLTAEQDAHAAALYGDGYSRVQIAAQAAPGSLSALRAATVGALWCVNVQGPDDVYAMPDRDAALERANELNAFFGQQLHHQYDPIMRAVVIEWPHSAESHAADLREQPFQSQGHGAPTGRDRTSGWIPVDERRPEIGTSCIVWIAPEWDALEPFAAVDRWDEWRESPVSFSSATVVVGEGWMESDPAEVTHWMPLPGAPTGQSRTSENGEATCASNEPDEQDTSSVSQGMAQDAARLDEIMATRLKAAKPQFTPEQLEAAAKLVPKHLFQGADVDTAIAPQPVRMPLRWGYGSDQAPNMLQPMPDGGWVYWEDVKHLFGAGIVPLAPQITGGPT